MQQAGLRIELDVDEAAADGVADVVGAAGYRIVQEALTNVARHAGPAARAHVRVTRIDGRVDVEVRDDGHGAPTVVRPRGGLVSMRERALALGGTFQAGHVAGGGFRVHASLPRAPR
jgi:signal transduction histidine kinase